MTTFSERLQASKLRQQKTFTELMADSHRYEGMGIPADLLEQPQEKRDAMRLRWRASRPSPDGDFPVEFYTNRVIIAAPPPKPEKLKIPHTTKSVYNSAELVLGVHKGRWRRANGAFISKVTEDDVRAIEERLEKAHNSNDWWYDQTLVAQHNAAVWQEVWDLEVERQGKRLDMEVM